jgi:TP901-1 family phage major tail protein
MAILNATDVVLSVTVDDGLKAIAHCTSASISMNMDLRDSTTKSSGGWQDNLGGLRSYELSGDAFVDLVEDTEKSDILELWTVWNQRAAVIVSFGIAGMLYEGTALITSLSIDAGVEENATFSISLTGSGALTQNDI